MTNNRLFWGIVMFGHVIAGIIASGCNSAQVGAPETASGVEQLARLVQSKGYQPLSVPRSDYMPGVVLEPGVDMSATTVVANIGAHLGAPTSADALWLTKWSHESAGSNDLSLLAFFSDPNAVAPVDIRVLLRQRGIDSVRTTFGPARIISIPTTVLEDVALRLPPAVADRIASGAPVIVEALVLDSISISFLAHRSHAENASIAALASQLGLGYTTSVTGTGEGILELATPVVIGVKLRDLRTRHIQQNDSENDRGGRGPNTYGEAEALVNDLLREPPAVGVPPARDVTEKRPRGKALDGTVLQDLRVLDLRALGTLGQRSSALTTATWTVRLDVESNAKKLRIPVHHNGGTAQLWCPTREYVVYDVSEYILNAGPHLEIEVPVMRGEKDSVEIRAVHWDGFERFDNWWTGVFCDEDCPVDVTLVILFPKTRYVSDELEYTVEDRRPNVRRHTRQWEGRDGERFVGKNKEWVVCRVNAPRRRQLYRVRWKWS
jgi:hypothetical protein